MSDRLREQLEVAIAERPVCPHDGIRRSEWACARCDVDAIWPLIVADREQTRQDEHRGTCCKIVDGLMDAVRRNDLLAEVASLVRATENWRNARTDTASLPDSPKPPDHQQQP